VVGGGRGVLARLSIGQKVSADDSDASGKDSDDESDSLADTDYWWRG
jgi:hypothetical protein